jgi:hypothetical protein
MAMATCKLCFHTSTFKLCEHGVCACCRVSGLCEGCEEYARIQSLAPAESAAWLASFMSALETGMDYSDSCRFAWASVRTDFPHLRNA